MQLFRVFQKRKEIMSTFANRNEGRERDRKGTEINIIKIISHADEGRKGTEKDRN